MNPLNQVTKVEYLKGVEYQPGLAIFQEITGEYKMLRKEKSTAVDKISIIASAAIGLGLALQQPYVTGGGALIAFYGFFLSQYESPQLREAAKKVNEYTKVLNNQQVQDLYRMIKGAVLASEHTKQLNEAMFKNFSVEASSDSMNKQGNLINV